MRISRIYIKNFRNFQEVTVQTGKNIVLVGANATGKSNFIFALRLVLDPSLSHQDRRLGEEDFWRGNGEQPWKGREIQISIDFTDFMDDEYLKAHLKTCIIPNNPEVARLTYLYRPKSHIEPEVSDENSYEYVIYSGLDAEDANKRVYGVFRDHLCVSVIDAMRNTESDLVSRKSPLRKLFDLYNINPDLLGGVAEYMKKANGELKNVKEVGFLASEIGKRLMTMTENIHDLQPSIQLISEDTVGLMRALRLMIEGGYAISSTSLGLSNVLFLTLCLLEVEAREKIRYPVRDEQYLFTIVAIEEPEAHLHPHLQRLLFRNFLERSPLILSTHSPYIASVAQLDSIVMLRRNDLLSGTEVRATASLYEKLTESQRLNLARHLNITRAEILFARAVIWVEGDAEEILVPVLAQMAGYDLDKFGITVCSVRSTDFSPFFQLCGPEALNIPCIILTDGDKYAKLNDGLSAIRGGNLSEAAEVERMKGDKIPVFEKRSFLEDRGVAYYFGFKRCLDIIDDLKIDVTIYQQIKNAYDRMDWSIVQELLWQQHFYVNLWSLEPSLLEIGFGNDILKALIAEGIGPRIQKRLEKIVESRDFCDQNIYEFLKQIEAKGKGRIAKRLEETIIQYIVHSSLKDIPLYILKGVEYLIGVLSNRKDWVDVEDIEIMRGITGGSGSAEQ